VDVWLAAGTDSIETTLPDLAGLTLRQAIRELNRRQIAPRYVGHGVVVSQSPAPGTPLPLDQPCVLRCEPRPPVAAAALLPCRRAAAAPAPRRRGRPRDAARAARPHGLRRGRGLARRGGEGAGLRLASRRTRRRVLRAVGGAPRRLAIRAPGGGGGRGRRDRG